MPMDHELKRVLTQCATSDVATLEIKGDSYGDSWKRRGGVGAFMMLARKWDRIENMTKQTGWDIFQAPTADESILDDIRDLRCYLLLVESEILFSRRDPFAAQAMREYSAAQNGDR